MNSNPSFTKTIEQLLDYHEQLLGVAKRKQEVLKEQDVEALATILRDEQKLVAMIQMVETKRQKQAVEYTNVSHPSFEQVLACMSEPEQQQLRELYKRFNECVDELKHQNELNQELLKLALQFIHLNLDLLTPEQGLENYSQSREDETESNHQQSVFDSKA